MLLRARLAGVDIVKLLGSRTQPGRNVRPQLASQALHRLLVMFGRPSRQDGASIPLDPARAAAGGSKLAQSIDGDSRWRRSAGTAGDNRSPT